MSAGFDAHAADPVGGMRVSTEGFSWMSRALEEVAETFAGGRIVSLLEGGYRPRSHGGGGRRARARSRARGRDHLTRLPAVTSGLTEPFAEDKLHLRQSLYFSVPVERIPGISRRTEARDEAEGPHPPGDRRGRGPARGAVSPGGRASNWLPLRWAQQALACPSQTLGSIDVPVDGATVSGYVQVIGFALDGNLVSSVDVFVDGTDDSNRVTADGANINLPRPDVIQFFPQYAGTAGQHPGYQASFKATIFSNGSHTIYVRVTDVTGCSYFLTPRAVQDRQHAQPDAVRRRRLSAARQRRERERRPRGGGLGARRPQGRPRGRPRGRPPRAAGRDGHLPRRRRRELSGQPAGDRRGIHPEHRLDALRERRPHRHRQSRGRPGPAGPARHAPRPDLQQRPEPRAVRRGRVPAPERDVVRQLLPDPPAARPAAATSSTRAS